MSNYSNTKATIAANVYTNHNNEVTAEMVKAGINAVVDALIAGGYLWAGVAHPGDAASTPDANVVKVATEVGTYKNYKNSSNVALTVAAGEVAVFTYNGSWSKEVTGAATAAEVTALGQEVGVNAITAMVDAGIIEIEAGTFTTAGANNPSDSRVRTKSAFYAPKYIGAPEGYYVQFVFYFSSWTSASTYTLDHYDTINATGAIITDVTKLVRVSFRKVDNTSFTPSEFLSSLALVSPKISDTSFWGMYLEPRSSGSGYYLAFTLSGTIGSTSNTLTAILPTGFYMLRTGRKKLDSAKTLTASGELYYIVAFDHNADDFVCFALSSLNDIKRYSLIAIITAGSQNADPFVKTITPTYKFNGVLYGEGKTPDDTITTQKIADAAVTKEKVSPALLAETIGRIEHTFVFVATTGTYVSKYQNYNFINGHKYTIKIEYPAGYSGETYFSVRDSSGTPLQNDLGHGTASREITFVCNVNGGARWTLTLVPAHDSELSFAASIIDLDIVSIYSNRAILEAGGQVDPTGIISLNSKTWLDNIFEQSARAAKIPSGGGTTNAEAQLVLLHLSDIHGDKDNMSRVLEIYAAYGAKINDILCTGDMIEDKWSDDMDWWDDVEADNVLVTIGNHDVHNPGGSAITAVQAYNRYIAPFVDNWGVVQPSNAAANGYNYYYKDYASAKIRLVCLDNMFWDATQNTWLQGVLAGAKTLGYAVVCARHYPFGEEVAADTPFNSLMPRIYSGSSTDAALASVQDFIDNGGEFVCWLVGHTHDDYFGTITAYPDQLVITIANASCNAYWSDMARVIGQKSQDCFNVISFDYHQKMIKIARIGADYDRLLRHKGTLCYKYDTHELIQG